MERRSGIDEVKQLRAELKQLQAAVDALAMRDAIDKLAARVARLEAAAREVRS